MRLRILAVLVASTALTSLAAQTPEYDRLKADAEKLYADRSYSLATEAYQKAAALELSTADQRWVEFRLADTLWRSQAATEQSDTTKLDDARHRLEVLVRDVTRVEDRDLVWAEVHESLGDWFWRSVDSSPDSSPENAIGDGGSACGAGLDNDCCIHYCAGLAPRACAQRWLVGVIDAIWNSTRTDALDESASKHG